MIPDYALVDQVLEGENAAFGTLIERYQNALFVFLCSRLPGREQAEDLAQEIFLTAYTKLGSLEDPNRFGAWIFGIARRKVQLFYRERSRRRTQERVDLAEIAAPDFGEDPDRVLNELLTGLNDDQRIVLILRFREGLNYREISDRLDLPLGTVGTLLHRARALLKARHEKTNEASI